MEEQCYRRNLTSALWEHYPSESIRGQGKSGIAKGFDEFIDDSKEATMCKKLASLNLANINEVKEPSAETKPSSADSLHSILQNSSGLTPQEYLSIARKYLRQMTGYGLDEDDDVVTPVGYDTSEDDDEFDVGGESESDEDEDEEDESLVSMEIEGVMPGTENLTCSMKPEILNEAVRRRTWNQVCWEPSCYYDRAGFEI